MNRNQCSPDVDPDGDARFRVLVDAAREYAVLDLDPDGMVTTWNVGAERIMGYSPDEIVGRHYSCFYTSEDVAAEQPHRSLALASSFGRCEDEGRRVRKDGSSFLAHVLITALRSDDGELQGYVSVMRDDGVKTRTVRRYRELFDATPDAMVIVDQDFKIALVNSQAEKLLGYRRQQLIHQPVEILVPERFRMQNVDFWRRYMEKPQVRSMGAGRELFVRHHDGRELPVEVSLGPLETRHGLLALAAFRDITKRKQAEAALRQAEKLASLGSMAARIAHEVNNPLAAAWASAQAALNLKDETKPADEFDECLHNIIRSVKRCRNVVDAVLMLARHEQPHRARHNLNAVVRDAVELVQSRLTSDGAKVDFLPSNDLPDLLINDVEIGQVVTNLLGNAVDSGDKVHVTVRTDRIGDQCQILVRDTGRGMHDDELKWVFEPFFSGKASGTGLGLSIVHSIVTRHGGSIVIESEVGVGTVVTVTLPIIDGPESPDSGRALPNRNTQ